MEFWGVEVKSGTPLKVKPEEGMVIHLSQASMGEVKANKIESVSLFVNVDGKKLVLGTLLSDKLPQQLFDLVFDRDFELSHNSKSGSIYFFGYKGDNQPGEGEEFDFGESDEEEEEEDLLFASNNGKPEIKAVKEKPVVAEKAKESKGSAAGMQKVKIVEPTKDEKPEDDDSEDDDSDEDGSSDGDMMDEDDDSDSEDVEETPKKVVSGKKRGAESAIKTPVSQKKAKRVTPQKTDGKSGHVATPHPSKQAGKTPASKADQKTPKSGGVHSCGPCNKGFSSESALQAHTKAKHSAGK